MKYNLKVTIDQDSGFCFGVVYAIQMAEDILNDEGHLYCLGDIVHNDEEVARLQAKGLEIIDHEKFKTLSKAKVLIRAHGEPPETYQLALNNQIELVDANKANLFCIESGNIIGTTKDGNIARKNRKLVILDDENIKIWNGIKHNIMKEILLCKFTQNIELRNVLLLTKKAILLHGAKGIPISRQYDLEEVRNYLQL